LCAQLTRDLFAIAKFLFKIIFEIAICKLFAAEFIVNLADKNSTFESFKKVLLENGASFSVCI